MPEPAESSKLSQDCWEEVTKGIANCLINLNATWYGESQGQYQWERRQLEKYVSPLNYGAGSALFLFLTFRVAGTPGFQAWRNRMITKWQGYKDTHLTFPPDRLRSNLPKSQSPSKSHPPMGYLELKRDRDVQAALSSMRIITDLLVSVSTGISGSLLLVQAHQGSMRKDFEQSPLISGRSVVAEEVCTPFLEIAETYKAHLVEPANDDDIQKDPNLRSFMKFAENCRRRRDMEARIRKEQGLNEDNPVSVPFLTLERYRFYN